MEKQERVSPYAFLFPCYRPFLCQPTFKRNEGRVAWQIAQECEATCTTIHPFTCFFSLHILLPVLPYPLAPLSMPSYGLWIHLQIKQIYHSVMEAGKEGRLWNALALRAGKGSKRTATLSHTFPAAPALAFSDSVCLSVFLIHAIPPQPPLIHSCLTCTNQTHLSHQRANPAA